MQMLMKKLGRPPTPPVVKAELSVGRRNNLEKWGLARISRGIFPLIVIMPIASLIVTVQEFAEHFMVQVWREGRQVWEDYRDAQVRI